MAQDNNRDNILRLLHRKSGKRVAKQQLPGMFSTGEAQTSLWFNGCPA
jgi:hypothetical protein